MTLLLKSFLSSMLCFFILSTSRFADNQRFNGGAKPIATCDSLNPYVVIDRLFKDIRDKKIVGDTAKHLVMNQLKRIDSCYLLQNPVKYSKKDWKFPVKGYTYKEIGGRNGNGYIPNKFDFYDTLKRKSHPAQDIFVFDKNQDNIDDRTGKRADIVSMSGGVVICVENSWEPTSLLRGGKYVWVYDVDSRGFFYYAHNDTVCVQPGDVLVPGQKLAELGRTGLNAYKKRSPTHLHIMYLKLQSNGDLAPVNLYSDLVKAKH
jgi:peptidoglycan LD-endopeptidase LytH